MASNHYVNNADFLQALITYRQDVAFAQTNGQSKPQVPKYVGECILKIANHLSYKPNFINYSYRDEMIGDGIENCLTYIDNFDPSKSSNPFAYFTQIVYYAFIRRIQREKKQTTIKGRMIMDMPTDAFVTQDHDDGTSYTSTYLDFIRASGVYDDVLNKDDAQRAKIKDKAKRNKGPSLEDIMEEVPNSDDE